VAAASGPDYVTAATCCACDFERRYRVLLDGSFRTLPCSRRCCLSSSESRPAWVTMLLQVRTTESGGGVGRTAGL